MVEALCHAVDPSMEEAQSVGLSGGGMGVRGLLHRNPQFLYLHHSSDGTVKAQNSMQLPSADCATNCANGHVSRHSLWEVALSIWRPPRGMIALSRGNRQGLGPQI